MKLKSSFTNFVDILCAIVLIVVGAVPLVIIMLMQRGGMFCYRGGLDGLRNDIRED